ncbi:hypothetical protein ACGC1H_003144 [Rhizoctonia solani]
MAEELNTATNLLNYALDHYFKTCSNLRIHYRPGPNGRIDIPSKLTNRVVQEASLVVSYETEIQQSKATISRLHNFNGLRNVRSIFSLPREILARIFRTVCNMHLCPQSVAHVYSASKPPSFAMDLIILSHVCSHWREVAISLVDLWSHIDIEPNQFRIPGSLARVNAYLARSGPLLDIHIGELLIKDDLHETMVAPSQADPDFLEFITAVAPRMRSLTISATHSSIQGTLYYPILSACFANCVPGRLVHLDFGFVGEIDRSRLPGGGIDTDTTLVGLPKETLEALWHPIKFMRLDQFYPAWTSKAYHGLVELNLAGSGSIPESGLVGILKSSPGLRVLKIQLRITRLTPKGARITPIPLVDLEQLSAISVGEAQLGYLLRLIAPGTKPLGLTLVNPWLGSTMERRVHFTSWPETRSFFARANVTRLCANSFNTYQQFEYILAMVPSVRVLILDGCNCRQVPEESTLPPDFALDELYVVSSTAYGAVTWPSIERIVEKHHIRKLILWRYDHRHNGLGGYGMAVVPNNLSTVCPEVIVVSDEAPNPIEDWK